MQQRHQVAEQCKKRRHQPSDAYGTQGKATLVFMMHTRCQTANITAVSIGPIVTKSMTKLDNMLEGTCIGRSQVT